MIRYQTLPEMLDDRSRGDAAIVYLEGEGAEKSLKLAELRRRALGILFHLQRIGARPADFVILHVASNEQFIDAYWACLYGGIVPVPVAVGISDEHKHKLLRIAQHLGNPFLYTDRKLRDRLAAFAATSAEAGAWTGLKSRTFVVDELDDISRAGVPAQLTAEQTAFVQFSSGSTSDPKGVVLTHRNVLANCEGARQGTGFCEQDVSLSWMPLTHDMGLIGFHLMMMYAGVRQHLMPTDLFVRRALLWLKWSSQKRVTVTCSPNFGYRHCLRALGDKHARRRLARFHAPVVQRRRAHLGGTRRGIPRPARAVWSPALGDVSGLWPGRGFACRQFSGAWLDVSVHHGRPALAGRRHQGAARRTRAIQRR